jgi:tripartite-type tricarboxylate transporter receptor subunit TctC
VPTAAEAGIKDFVVDSWFGLVVPAGTPDAIVDRLNAEVVRIGALPEVRERLEAQGLSVTTSTREAFAKTIKDDYARWAKVVDAAGAKLY